MSWNGYFSKTWQQISSVLCGAHIFQVGWFEDQLFFFCFFLGKEYLLWNCGHLWPEVRFHKNWEKEIFIFLLIFYLNEKTCWRWLTSGQKNISVFWLAGEEDISLVGSWKNFRWKGFRYIRKYSFYIFRGIQSNDA